MAHRSKALQEKTKMFRSTITTVTTALFLLKLDCLSSKSHLDLVIVDVIQIAFAGQTIQLKKKQCSGDSGTKHLRLF